MRGFTERLVFDSMRFRPHWELAQNMSSPVQCTRCSHVYDLGKVTVTARFQDCSVWRCPGCRITVDDRPVGWGDHHYRELPRRATREEFLAERENNWPSPEGPEDVEPHD